MHISVAVPSGPENPSSSGGYAPRNSQSLDSLPSFPAAKLKLDSFFLLWLSENQSTVNALLDDVMQGRQPRAPTLLSSGASPLSPSTAHNLFSTVRGIIKHNKTALTLLLVQPPLSPSKVRSPRSPISPQRKSLTSSSVLKKSSVSGSSLPPFYFPAQPVLSEATVLVWTSKVNKAYEAYPNGLPPKAFVDMLLDVCELPTMLGWSLCKRLVGIDELVAKEVIIDFWKSRKLIEASLAVKMFQVLKQEGQSYLTYEDFQPFMDSVLQYHPGLEFLKETAEFQKKYAETVVYRIYYNANRTGNGRLTLKELEKSDVPEAIDILDKEDDINKILKYFSYEHFYVIYCKFWELDQDHDFFIDRSDLAHYGHGSLSYQIIDKVFEQVPRKFSSTQPGKMGYEDFVWFILSEEDKTSDTALDYWFKCADLDCAGFLTPREMWHFYEEQIKRMETLPSAEAVHFQDVVCQLHDMLSPEIEGRYTLRDLKKKKPQSALLFNALFNLHKFLNFENRDPFAMRAEAGEFGGLSEWEKFAKIEYFRLASEDDGQQDNQDAQASHWGLDTSMI